MVPCPILGMGITGLRCLPGVGIPGRFEKVDSICMHQGHIHSLFYEKLDLSDLTNIKYKIVTI